MRQLIEHLREDVGKVTEPKAQALFETSAEVVTGLVKAFDDYENKSEEAWRTVHNGTYKRRKHACPKAINRSTPTNRSVRRQTERAIISSSSVRMTRTVARLASVEIAPQVSALCDSFSI